MSFVWTAQVTKTVIDLWNAGKTGNEIAEVINAPSRGSVTRKISRLRAQGVSVETRPSPITLEPMKVEAGTFAWTAENVQTAIELWNSGRSGGEIAQAISAPSRDAITRKLSRLRAQGLVIQARPSPIKPKPVSVEAETSVIPVPSPARSDGPVSLMEAGFCQCRYPLWDGQSEPKSVCGKRTTNANSSWCEEHHKLIWKSAENRVRPR